MKTNILKTLKKKYDNKPLSFIEKTANKAKQLSYASRKDFILILNYLEMTKRYREDRTYKNADFKTYISDKFHLLFNTYYNERIAYERFPELSQKFGTGLVMKIKETCGNEKVEIIFGKIPPKATREQISDIISKFAKRGISDLATKQIRDYKASYHTAIADLKAVRVELKVAYNTIQEKEIQIEKLKEAVKRLGKINDRLRR